MNTTENNKIIAEFMIKQEPTENFCVGSIGQEVGVFTGIKTEYFKYEDLKFHSDWNWLMEVIKQIVESGIFIRYDNNKFYKNISKFEIKSSYKSCVEFIKWYNKNAVKS